MRAAVVLAVLSAAAYAQTPGIEIENEDYTAFYDAGGTPIQKVTLSGCSGGYILTGLDAPGEWVQYNVSPLAYGYYSFNLAARGDFGAEYEFRLVFTPSGSGTVQAVDFIFMGQGYG